MNRDDDEAILKRMDDYQKLFCQVTMRRSTREDLRRFMRQRGVGEWDEAIRMLLEAAGVRLRKPVPPE